jgi:WD40-like Beta Propeller Repeat
MSFHPIRDIILAFLAGCLGFAAKGQGPSAVGSGAVGSGSADTISAGVPVDIVAPNAQAQPFAPGVVASKYEEWATSFSPDNKTVYFSRGAIYWTVCYAENKGGVWQRPQVASFSGVWKDTDPFVSPDGKRLFFVSNRPVESGPGGGPGSAGMGGSQEMEGKKSNSSFHLWYVGQLPGGGWGVPQHIGDAVNIDSSSNYGPSVSAKGTLYWCSRNRQGNEGMQGYYAVWLGDHYTPPKLLKVPGASSVQDPFISADEKYMVFLNGSDIYICYRQGDEWGPAQKLGPEVNTGDGNSSPYVSHDGKTLYYSSGRIKGFYVRKEAVSNYDQLEKENQNWCNGSGNILMVPIRLPDGM